MAGNYTRIKSEKSSLLNEHRPVSTKQQRDNPQVLLFHLEECQLESRRKSEIDEQSEGLESLVD
jgi:hypothetical protein